MENKKFLFFIFFKYQISKIWRGTGPPWCACLWECEAEVPPRGGNGLYFWMNCNLNTYVQIVSGARWNIHSSNKTVRGAPMIHRGAPAGHIAPVTSLPPPCFWCRRAIGPRWHCDGWRLSVQQREREALRQPSLGHLWPPLSSSSNTVTKPGTRQRRGLWTAACRWRRFPGERRGAPGAKANTRQCFKKDEQKFNIFQQVIKSH